METFKITLSNGNEIEDLTMNGNNFVSEEVLTEDIFEGGLDEVVITSSEGTEETLTNAKLVALQQLSGCYYFVLRELTEAEKTQNTMQSQIEYIAMMTDVEI